MDINSILINFAKPEASGLVSVIAWLVKITASVALGVILFTLILKLITLPFDFISRKSMRKNSLIMEDMRPELEKLQRQYADNKDLYNQKMMALYKKNGYSVMSSCLPTIITLVIFIVAIRAFTNYSNFQNRKYFYDMSVAYNSVVYDGFKTDGEYIYKDQDGNLIINSEKIYNDSNNGTQNISLEDYDILVSVNNDKLFVSTTNGYIEFEKPLYNQNGDLDWSTFGVKYNLIEDNIKFTYENYESEKGERTAIEYLKDLARENSAQSFRNSKAKFLWVKNIWVTDSPLSHPIESDWNKFKSTYGYKSEYNDIGESGYSELIFNLSEEQSQANGYFILVALTAITSLLTQLIMTKSQKAQMELQTVDGQGAQTQKVMTYMMPIMMAIFAFMYTAAFSIYIILSSTISIISTLGINAIVDKQFKNKKAKTSNSGVIRGRVYTPKQEEQPKKEKKIGANKQIPEKGDFLSGKADKKRK